MVHKVLIVIWLTVFSVNGDLREKRSSYYWVIVLRWLLALFQSSYTYTLLITISKTVLKKILCNFASFFQMLSMSSTYSFPFLMEKPVGLSPTSFSENWHIPEDCDIASFCDRLRLMFLFLNWGTSYSSLEVCRCRFVPEKVFSFR